jgi:hypothetical protein
MRQFVISRPFVFNTLVGATFIFDVFSFFCSLFDIHQHVGDFPHLSQARLFRTTQQGGFRVGRQYFVAIELRLGLVRTLTVLVGAFFRSLNFHCQQATQFEAHRLSLVPDCYRRVSHLGEVRRFRVRSGFAHAQEIAQNFLRGVLRQVGTAFLEHLYLRGADAEIQFHVHGRGNEQLIQPLDFFVEREETDRALEVLALLSLFQALYRHALLHVAEALDPPQGASQLGHQAHLQGVGGFIGLDERVQPALVFRGSSPSAVNAASAARE